MEELRPEEALLPLQAQEGSLGGDDQGEPGVAPDGPHLARRRALSPGDDSELAGGGSDPPAKRRRVGAPAPLRSMALASAAGAGRGLDEEEPPADSGDEGEEEPSEPSSGVGGELGGEAGADAVPASPPPAAPINLPARSSSDLHTAAAQLARLRAGSGERAASPPAPFCAMRLSRLPSSALLQLGHRILSLYKQQHQEAPAPPQSPQKPLPAAEGPQREQQERQEQPGPAAAAAAAPQPPLRPSTPVLPQAAAAGGQQSAEELARRLARAEEELGGLREQLSAAQRALTLQEGARVALAAELEWARGEAKSAQAQRGATEVVMTKNSELQEQVRQLSTRLHMLQQQLVAAMAARERRHAEAQQVTADRDALQQQLAEAGSRQRALHKQVSALDARAAKAERELEGVRAARDWLAPQLDTAMADRARLTEELRLARAALEAATSNLAASHEELALWRTGSAGADAGGC